MSRAIYVRTSTDDNDGEAQLHELRTYAAGRGWADCREYIDRGESGTKDSRPAWDELQRDVHRGAVKEWAATELARLGRGGVLQVAPFLDECCRRGVRVVLTRTGLDYSTPTGRMVANILLEVAAMERATIVERVRAGVRRAKEKGTRSGKPIGRPPRAVPENVIRNAVAGLAAGRSWASVAHDNGYAETTLRRAIQARQNPA